MTQQLVRVYSVNQAADHLRIGRTKLYGLLGSGLLRSFTVGRLRRILEDDLQYYIDRVSGQAATDRQVVDAESGHGRRIGDTR